MKDPQTVFGQKGVGVVHTAGGNVIIRVTKLLTLPGTFSIPAKCNVAKLLFICSFEKKTFTFFNLSNIYQMNIC